jgi:hypothetical protein
VSDEPLVRLRVRGNLPLAAEPSGANKPPRLYWPRPGEPGLLIHTVTDETDRLIVATAREVELTHDRAVTISERLYTWPDQVPDAQAALGATRPDVPAGLGATPVRVDDLGTGGRLISNRLYRQRQPGIGWDQPRRFGQLAAHAGPARSGCEMFFLRLFGFDVQIAGGLWRWSWLRPTLMVTPRGPGQAGAFYRWVETNDPLGRARLKWPPRAMVDLRILTGALCGHDLDDPAQASRMFGITWPEDVADPVERLRLEARALVELYGQCVYALAEIAPGMHPADAHSFGSITNHLLGRRYL